MRVVDDLIFAYPRSNHVNANSIRTFDFRYFFTEFDRPSGAAGRSGAPLRTDPKENVPRPRMTDREGEGPKLVVKKKKAYH